MRPPAPRRPQDIWKSMCSLTDTGYVPISDEEVRLFQGYCGAVPGQTAVDIGTGTGEWACEIARLGLTVTGYDSNSAAIEWAREVHREHSPRLHFARHDFTADVIPVSLRPGSADIVSCRHSLHLMDVPRLMTDIRRWLRPDGVLHVTTTVADDRAAGLPDAQVSALTQGWREHHQYTVDPHRQVIAIILRGPGG
ncbi:class I SAM-dependent methyltransferase [Streptomyces filamentosus]|uniref:class I SAM-dependent methyltransferase n=1 Tax=Streptomyces filamentosus TaxID=67294 RepID=UPI0034087C35